MNKVVHSAIESLDSVSALQTASEDQEAIAHNTAENSEKEAFSNSEDPVQNNGSENDAEHHHFPVCASPRMKSERKIKPLTVMRLCRKGEFQCDKVKTIQPNRRNRVRSKVLMNGSMSSFNPKRGLNTVICLARIQAIRYWDTGVAAREQHLIPLAGDHLRRGIREALS